MVIMRVFRETLTLKRVEDKLLLWLIGKERRELLLIISKK
jgi:hypothetical protein